MIALDLAPTHGAIVSVNNGVYDIIYVYDKNNVPVLETLSDFLDFAKTLTLTISSEEEKIAVIDYDPKSIYWGANKLYQEKTIRLISLVIGMLYCQDWSIYNILPSSIRKFYDLNPKSPKKVVWDKAGIQQTPNSDVNDCLVLLKVAQFRG